MIICSAKPLEEVITMVEPFDRLIVAGCNGCVTVCRAGGEKEVQIVAAALRLNRGTQGKQLHTREVTLERQCDPEYVETMRPFAGDYGAVLSLACGAGAQMAAERFAAAVVLPGVNTNFIGVNEKQGVWSERCQGCGECVLHLTGGVCPIARCSKSLLNGPCGGSMEGHCELGKDVPCGWQLIIDRLKALGRLDMYSRMRPMKRWKTSRDGGPRRIIREDLV